MQKIPDIPESLVHLKDLLLEGLSAGEARDFSLRFGKVISHAAAISKVEYTFKLWLLTDRRHGLKQWANEETQHIIDEIAVLLREASEGTLPSDDRWRAAESAAWNEEWRARSAAESVRSAAESAAWSAAESARSAAESARSAARSAEWSSALGGEIVESSAWSAARSTQYTAMADKLITLLEEQAP